MARILIIDDEHDIWVALRVTLEKAGHKVLEASNGQEGVKLYVQNPTDLVITDILMPEKDGVEILLELRADYPDVKIIAMSGGGHDFLPMAKEFGALRTLRKPFRRADLLQAVKEVLAEER